MVHQRLPWPIQATVIQHLGTRFVDVRRMNIHHGNVWRLTSRRDLEEVKKIILRISNGTNILIFSLVLVKAPFFDRFPGLLILGSFLPHFFFSIIHPAFCWFRRGRSPGNPSIPIWVRIVWGGLSWLRLSGLRRVYAADVSSRWDLWVLGWQPGLKMGKNLKLQLFSVDLDYVLNGLNMFKPWKWVASRFSLNYFVSGFSWFFHHNPPVAS